MQNSRYDIVGLMQGRLWPPVNKGLRQCIIKASQDCIPEFKGF